MCVCATPKLSTATLRLPAVEIQRRVQAGCYSGVELSLWGMGEGIFHPYSCGGKDADKISWGGGVGGREER